MSAKTQTKSAAKLAKTQKPIAAAIAKVVDITIETKKAIQCAFKASVGASNATMKEVEAFKAVLLTVQFNSPQYVHKTLVAIDEQYGLVSKDKADYLKVMIRNAVKVVTGGTKDHKLVKGKGIAGLTAAIEGVSTVTLLRKALSAAKPDALKESGSGSGTKSAAAKDVAASKGKQVKAVPGTPVQAIKQALDILAVVAALNVFSPGSDAELLGLIKALRSRLETKEIALRMLKAA